MEEPAIATTRLRLRPFSLGDVDNLHMLWNEPGVRKYLWDDQPVPREQVESIIEHSIALFTDHGFGLWAVLSHTADELMGFCGFWHFHEPPKLELVFGIEPTRWNQGFASEILTAMLRYGFEKLSFQRIEASTDYANQASARVMERAGMTLWKRETTNGLDTIYYAISRQEFNRTIL
jgi:ribosomal-protein-alanine N-acetyltransferase